MEDRMGGRLTPFFASTLPITKPAGLLSSSGLYNGPGVAELPATVAEENSVAAAAGPAPRADAGADARAAEADMGGS